MIQERKTSQGTKVLSCDIPGIVEFINHLDPKKFFTPCELFDSIQPYRGNGPLIDVALIFSGCPGPIRAINVLIALAIAVDASIWLIVDGDRISFNALRSVIEKRLSQISKEVAA